MSSPPPSTTTMKAVVWEGKVGEMAVRRVPKPKIVAPEDAIVRMTTAAICGTDLHTYHGVLGSTTPPWIVGHEGVGIVVEVGSATEHFKVGDRVLIPGGANAGFYNVEGTLLPQKEREPVYGMGSDFGLEGIGGTQAEFFRVPFADDSLVLIPNNTSPDTDWLFLTDIFPTAWAGLDFARFQAGKSVAVFGCGPVGLMCIYAARLRGASEIFAVDHVPDRLVKAEEELGAIPIDFSSGRRPSEQILRFRSQGVECVVDCCGQDGALNHELKPQQNYILQEAVRVVSLDGGIGLIGVYGSLPTSEGAPRGGAMEADLAVPMSEMWIKNVSLMGGSVFSVYYDALPRTYELVRTRRAKLDFVVSSRIGIDWAPEAYSRFDRKLETKVVIEFPWKREEEEALVAADAVQVNGVGVGEGGHDEDPARRFRLPAPHTCTRKPQALASGSREMALRFRGQQA